MNGSPTEQTAEAVELALRAALARGEAVTEGARPILRHLLGDHDPTLFSEELVARVRGMMLDLARQLLFAEAEAADVADRAAYAAARRDTLAGMLAEDDGLLAHAQSVALEAQLAERLQASNALDPVLSPLMQDLTADADPRTADLAMTALAAQARFMQQYRRMELPMAELPGDLVHRILLVQRRRGDDPDVAAATERLLRERYREGAGRAALLARLVLEAGHPAARSLDIADAGVAIFATALSLVTEDSRTRTVMGMAGPQFARFGLSLRAAGLSPAEVVARMSLLHPDSPLAATVAGLSVERAAALLASSASELAERRDD